MKVLQIIDSLNVGGAEVLAVNISNGLASRNIESHLCVTRKEGELKSMVSDKVGYIFLNRKKTLDIKAIQKLKKYVKDHQIRIIHAHSTSYFMAVCIKILLPKTRIIWHDHYGNSEFLTSKSRRPIRMASFLFRSVITVNTKLLKWNQKYLHAKNYSLLNNFPEFTDLSKETKLQGKEGKRIVHVAGFTEQKDHLNLLRAFKEVLKKHPKWTLHLIGKKYQGSYTDSVLNYISDNSLSNNVFTYGVCTDIKNILSQSTIGVLSSKSEGLPVSLLEYGLAKLPVVITDVGECGKLIKNQNVIAPPENSKAFSKAIVYLIENEEEQNQVASDFFSLVSQDYTLDAFLDKTISIYNT